MISIFRPALNKILVAAILIASATYSSSVDASDQNNKVANMSSLTLKASNGYQCNLTLADTKTATSLLGKLPLELSLEDFGDSERIAYLKDKLEVDDGTNNPQEGKAGDVAYYTPWGNLAFFKKDFTFSKDLLFIGRVDMDCIRALVASESAVISK